MQRIIDIATSENSIVLDFFSGSGSMAEAVMTKNGEDAGARRFVLVQIPEEATGDYATLCDMGEERIRRAGKKIAEEVEEGNQHLKIGEEPRPVPDVGFRVFRIDSSNFRETYREPGEVDQSSIFEFVDNLKDDRTAEDLLFQVLPKFRIPYSAKVEERQVCGKRVFDVNGGQLVACFDDEVGADAIEAIAKERPLYAVFRDSSLADDATEANFEELFKTYSPDTIRRVI
jgi:adenine-specific DNA-methyltransferase